MPPSAPVMQIPPSAPGEFNTRLTSSRKQTCAHRARVPWPSSSGRISEGRPARAPGSLRCRKVESSAQGPCAHCSAPVSVTDDRAPSSHQPRSTQRWRSGTLLVDALGGLLLPIRYLTNNGRICECSRASIAERSFTRARRPCRSLAIDASALRDLEPGRIQTRANDAERLRDRVIFRPTKLRAMDRLLTAEEIADRLGMKTDWVWAQARAGRIPHVRLGRYRRFRESAVEAWLNDLETGGVTPMVAQPTRQRRRV